MKIYTNKHDSLDTQRKVGICNETIKTIQERFPEKDARPIFEKWLIGQIYIGSNMVIENGNVDFKLFTYDEALEIKNRITD